MRNKIHKIRSLKTHPRLIAWLLIVGLLSYPLSSLASTPIDSEIKPSQPHLYAFASYFEIYEVEPSQHHVSQVEKTFIGGKLPSDARVNFYLLRHITAVKLVESPEELRTYQTALSNISKILTDQSTQGTNPITSWAWDIDNNGTTDYTSQNPQHTYSGAGTYSVKLTVSDGTLNDSEIKTGYIVVSTPPSGPSVIQDLSYTYDAVGNITQIVDASQTSTAKSTTYGYDDLHRLTSAVTINAANGQNYNHTYVYDAIGSITNMTGVGAYLYQSTGKANPHAATSVNGVTYAYDNNRNLTS